MSDRKSEIWRIIKETKTLPTLPGVITKLSKLSENDKTSVQEMARIVSSDQVLCARVLKLVNSPSYGFSRVSTISHAMILLGVNVIKSLALSTSIFEIMERNIMGLWEHSLGAGVAANIICRRLGVADAEEISTAALVHDLGKVIIKLKFEKEYAEIINVVRGRRIHMIDAEREILEVDHAEVAELLVKSWYLPEKLVEPVAYHHDVERAKTYRVGTAIVHLADVLIKGSGFGCSGDCYVHRISPVAWDLLGMSEELLAEIIEELEDKLIDVKNFSMEVQSGDGATA